jgi:hypothetical protein
MTIYFRVSELIYFRVYNHVHIRVYWCIVDSISIRVRNRTFEEINR